MPLNLADPNFEPTDEDLQRLSREAFADVAARNREALERIHAEIAVLRAAVLKRVRGR